MKKGMKKEAVKMIRNSEVKDKKMMGNVVLKGKLKKKDCKH